MNKGNLEQVLGGTFVAQPGFEGEVEGDVDAPASIPGMTSPERIFESGFDAEVAANKSKFAPPYKKISGRFDPFQHEQLKASVGTWSMLINRPVVTFEDTCEHAMALCRMWVQEDKEMEVLVEKRKKEAIQREANNQIDIMVEGTKAYAVEQARIAWREGVKKRDEIVKQWNDYVGALRTEYRRLRDE